MAGACGLTGIGSAGDVTCRTLPESFPETTSNQQQDTRGNASIEDICRICHDNENEMVLITACLCKGTIGKAHRECLEHWISISSKYSCEICKFKYITVRKPKYTGFASVYHRINASFSDEVRIFVLVTLIGMLFCFFYYGLLGIGQIMKTYCVRSSITHHFVTKRVNPLFQFREILTCPKGNVPTARPHRNFADYMKISLTIIGMCMLHFFIVLIHKVFLSLLFPIPRRKEEKDYVITIVPLEDCPTGYPTPSSVLQSRDLANETNSEVVAETNPSHGNGMAIKR